MPVIRSRTASWFVVVVGVLLLCLGVLNLVINTRSLGSWVPLVVLMPLVIALGVRGLRATSGPTS